MDARLRVQLCSCGFPPPSVRARRDAARSLGLNRTFSHDDDYVRELKTRILVFYGSPRRRHRPRRPRLRGRRRLKIDLRRRVRDARRLSRASVDHPVGAAANPHGQWLHGGGGNRTPVRGRTGQSVYKRSLRFDLARTAGSQTTYRRASHPVVSPLRRLALLRGQPVDDATTLATGRARSDALPNSVRQRVRVRYPHLRWFPVVLRGRPGTSTCSSAGEPTTSRPGRPRMFVPTNCTRDAREIRSRPPGEHRKQALRN